MASPLSPISSIDPDPVPLPLLTAVRAATRALDAADRSTSGRITTGLRSAARRRQLVDAVLQLLDALDGILLHAVTTEEPDDDLAHVAAMVREVRDTAATRTDPAVPEPCIDCSD